MTFTRTSHDYIWLTLVAGGGGGELGQLFRVAQASNDSGEMERRNGFNHCDCVVN
jgi:hypothetical protein